jgi:Spy/CpxP family protein refolding chaperone
MKRSTKVVIAIAGALVVALVAAGAAIASGRMHEGFAKRRITRHIDAALDAVAATPQQRDAIHAARDHVFETFAEHHKTQKADIDEALALWQSDRLDASKVAELRARHQAEAAKIGDAIVQAISDAHDALTATQRRQLADYLRAHKPPQLEGARPFFRHMMSERVDDVLDEIHATGDQRTKVHAAVERAFAAVAEGMGNHGADFDRAIGMFTTDTLDQAAVAQVRAEHQARSQKIGDAIVQALSDIHDVLDAGQRRAVADYVRAHHKRHGG